MDRKSILVLVACFLLLVTWPVLVKKLFPAKPLPPGAALTNAPFSASATNAPLEAAVLSAAPTNAIPAVAWTANTNVAEELLEVQTASTHFTFSSHGGGIKLIELLNYPETTSTRRKKNATNGGVATLNSHTPAPTLALRGGPEIEGDNVYQLVRTEKGVRATKELTNGLVVVKEFELGTNYLSNAKVRFENRSGQPLTIPAHEWVVGTATPMGARDDVLTIGVQWYNGAKGENVASTWFANRTMGCGPGNPRIDYHAGSSNVVWAAAHNQFFALVLMPKTPAEAINIREVVLPRPTGDQAAMVATNAAAPKGYFTTLAFPGQVLAPGQKLERDLGLYAGPKEYRRLARMAEEMKNELDLVMNFGFFGFFAKALLLTMNWFHDALRFSYGWAIVAITFIIKMIFWPLTQASTRSMKRMQALQPQMKELQEKYKDDPARMNKKLMEFMKENKVSPLGGCLPMLLQIPVFFGFFTMIKSAIELRGASWFWVGDLSQPDTLFMAAGLGWVPFIGIPGVGLPFNLLPLIMGVTMFWQAQLTPPSPGMDPTQQKIMRYMPLMFMVFLYNFSAGLTLYWTVQNMLTILQTKLTPVNPQPAGAPAPAHTPVLTRGPKKRK